MYLLMNKDKIVAAFDKNEDVLDNAYDLQETSKENKLPIGFEDINSWLEKRQAAKHRAHLRKLMAECGCLNMEGFIQLTHATSLNDSFWVKSEQESVCWKDVSLYQNEFDEVISKISFEGTGLYGIQFSTTTPEFGTDGSFEKCWKRDKQGIFLYKRGTTGASNAGMEPYSEVYASQLAAQICNKSVPYELVTLHKRTASRCKLFTSEKEGFVPFASIFPKKVSPRIMLNFYSGYGCEEEFRRMVILDAVTFNIDRHSGNHGVIFDNDTMEIKSISPIFDFNQALLPYCTKEDFVNIGSYLEQLAPRIGEDFIQIAKSLLNSEIRSDLINLQGFEFNYLPSAHFDKERLKLVERVIDRQIKGILDKGKMYTVDVFPVKRSIKKELEEKKNHIVKEYDKENVQNKADIRHNREER